MGKKEEIERAMRNMRGNGGGNGGSKWNKYQVKEASHKIRVLPSSITDHVAFHEVGFHYIGVWPRGKQCVCPKLTLGQPCPICDRWTTLYGTKLENEKVLSKVIAPKRKALYWVIDREGDQNSPLVWEASYNSQEQMLRIMGNPSWYDYDDPVKGSDITLTYTTVKNGANKYNVQPNMPSPIFTNDNHEYDEERYKALVTRLFPLSECYTRARSVGELQSILDVYESGEDVDAYINRIDDEKRSKRQQSDGSNGNGIGSASVDVEESIEEPVEDEPEMIGGEQTEHGQCDLVEHEASVEHEAMEVRPGCFGEYAEKDKECHPGDCPARKACIRLTGSMKKLDTPQKPTPPMNTSCVVVGNSPGSAAKTTKKPMASLDDVMKEAAGMKRNKSGGKVGV